MRYLDVLNLAVAYLPDLISEAPPWAMVAGGIPADLAMARMLPDTHYQVEIGTFNKGASMPYAPARGQSALAVLDGALDVAIGYGASRPPYACRMCLEGMGSIELTNPRTWCAYRGSAPGMYIRVGTNLALGPSQRPEYLVKTLQSRVRDIVEVRLPEILIKRAETLAITKL